MKTTVEWLAECKRRLGVESDYALAKRLGTSQQNISSYRTGKSRFDDDMALTVALILQVDPLQVIASANAERAKTPEQKARWIGVMEKFSTPFKPLLSLWNGVERRSQSRLYASR
jgi:transcriptional regulator with XRE-family HTH domain